MADEGRLLFDEEAQRRRRLTYAAAAGACLALLLWLTGIGGSFELKVYDSWFRVRGERERSAQVVVIAIDEKSIAQYGPTPWSRDTYAPLLQRLKEAGAAVIGFDITFPPSPRAGEPRERPGSTDRRSDNEVLADALRETGNVVVGFEFNNLGDASPPGTAPSAAVRKSVLASRPTERLLASPVLMPTEPLIAEAAAALGFVVAGPDPEDGNIRRVPLVIRHGTETYPSLSIQMARIFQQTPLSEVRLKDDHVEVGYASIPVLGTGEALLNWASTYPQYPEHSFVDVVRGDVTPEAFRGKAVIVAATAKGLDERSTPFRQPAPGYIIHATLLDSLFRVDFLSWPTWSWLLDRLLLVGLAAVAVLLFPRLKTAHLLLAGPVLVLGLVGAALFLFLVQGVWLKVFYPGLAVLLPLAATVALKLRETERVVRDVAAEKEENQKLLGLSFQEKGMLDMALATFGKLPLTDDIKAVYLNLGMDFENRTQREKAYLAYKRVFDVDPGFEDIAVRMENLKRVGVGTAVFAQPTLGVGTATAAPTVVPADSEATMGLAGGSTGAASTHIPGTQIPATQIPATQIPATQVPAATAIPGRPGAGTSFPGMAPQPGGQFGRYEILDKLGKGAMGEVFKVKDPRIGRVAAMKTIREDVDMAQAQRIEMRQRFYREAQTAGKLTHPNIVTIYDVGEELGTAYIVMEFVEGNTLTNLLRKGKPLTVAQVKHVVMQAAAGLDYAHQNGVYHRDVKPDNIMISKTGVVKVMDFGIARIAESDMTRTGSVLGTPAYMSPEQFSGKKVDGRADVFSLGVVLYELLTRKRPFRGDTATAIMFEILQKEPPPPSQASPDVSPEWDAILAQALAKDMAQRYQSALDLANAVRSVQAK